MSISRSRNERQDWKDVEKYMRDAGEVVGTKVAAETARMLQKIEKLSSIRPLLDILAKRS